MKLVSWNVNGLRSVLKKGTFVDFLDTHQPDIVCLQETKAGKIPIEGEWPTGYVAMFNDSQARAGHSGTAIFAKEKPLNLEIGLGEFHEDNEGRVQTAEFADFYLVNVYTPNSRRDLSRLEFREKTWDPAFLQHIQALSLKKPVIFCGDLNMAAEEIDIARPKDNRRNAGFTDEERAQMPRFKAAGFMDTFREFCPEPNHYTWWSFRPGVRQKNIGWRIDYFLATENLRNRLKEAWILPEIMGSDHCPVGIVIE